jgi:hypothetical protein
MVEAQTGASTMYWANLTTGAVEIQMASAGGSLSNGGFSFTATGPR